ncbi:methylated-DNA--[protein]-cysteine S-methyltransferase [Gammaproteobacteria bacterium]|nr:methylated-DNA--[protein]-cysteine S-methyltransferase [Gammaproteobacteria bacterium]
MPHHSFRPSVLNSIFPNVNAKILTMNTKSISSPIGTFDAFYNQIGLCKLSFIGQSHSEHPKDERLQKSVNNFFSDKGLQFFPAMDLQGTKFQLLVWNALCSIPRGSTASYGSIAEQIGSPNASRAVGTACKLNPIPLFIPCHRVVKQDHSIGQFALGTNNKKFLLKMESL